MMLMSRAASTYRKQRINPPAPSGTLLEQFAASLSAGQWAQMSPTPSGLGLFTGQQGSSGLSIAYASKLGRDPSGKKLYFIGCDHGDETLFIQYDEATNAFAEVVASVPWGVEATGTTSHGYDHTVFTTVNGKLWHRPYGTTTLRRWDGGTTWGSVGYGLAYQAATAGVAWFPGMGANGRIVVYQLENGVNGALVSVDPVTNAVTTHVNGSTGTLANTGDPHCWCIHSPQHNLVVFGGGNGSANVWKMDAAGTITQLNSVPGAITGTSGPAGEPSALPFCNPANGNIIVMQAANNWVELNPTAASGSQWTTKGGTASVLSTNTVGASAYGVACAPIPEYGIVAFWKNYTAAQPAQFWVWKAQ